MEQKDNYVGTGWENQYGINVSLNLEKIKALTPDAYGNVKVYVGKRKSVDEKSKSTHWVKESKPYNKPDSNTVNNNNYQDLKDNDSGLPF